MLSLEYQILVISINDNQISNQFLKNRKPHIIDQINHQFEEVDICFSLLLYSISGNPHIAIKIHPSFSQTIPEHPKVMYLAE